MEGRTIHPVLLREVKKIESGASLSSILSTERKDIMKKLVFIYNGEEYEPVECRSVDISIDGDTITLKVITDTTVPVHSVITPDESATFYLKGDDYDAFKNLSKFRAEENQVVLDLDAGVVYTIESNVYDIQDLMSVENSILDLIEKENELLAEGYKVIQCKAPRFDYADGSRFKLVETPILIKENVEKDVQLDVKEDNQKGDAKV